MAGGRLAMAGMAKAGRGLSRSAAAPRHDPRERAADRQTDAVMAGRGVEVGPGVPAVTARPGVSSPIVNRMGQGQGLDAATRGYFEPRFGADFSQVRIHAGSQAGRSAEAMGAEAYTDGRDLVFGPGRYAPASEAGRRLIAHELAHVVQNQEGLMRQPGQLFLKPKAVRFQDEPALDEVSDGKRVLKTGDSGEAVVRLTVALSELGHYTLSIIDERFDTYVAGAVTKFQTAAGLTGKVTADQCDKVTFDALDAKFAGGYAVERAVIGKQKAGSLLTGTDTLDTVERKAADRTISTEVKAVGGGPLPTFVPNIKGKGKYEDRLKTLVESVILDQYNRLGKDKGKDHKDPAKLYDWKQIELIARESQKATDAVFKAYYSGASPPALTHGTNLFDGWDDKEAQLKAGGKAKEDERANWRVQKIIEGKDVFPLDIEHGAVQSRKAEAAIIKRVKTALVGKYRTELIETDKGWTGFADPDAGKIFIQRFKGATPDRQRFDMWHYFYTFIHEYIHTLENPDQKKYRQTKSEKKGNKVLREGATEYLSHIVWSSITFDAALRKTIEGPFHDPLTTFKIPQFVGYAEFANAERMAGIVGIRNFLASYFLGKAELIGKP